MGWLIIGVFVCLITLLTFGPQTPAERNSEINCRKEMVQRNMSVDDAIKMCSTSKNWQSKPLP